MNIARKFNPLSWSRRTVVVVAMAFYAIFVPFYVHSCIHPAIATEEALKVSIPAVSISSEVESLENLSKSENKIIFSDQSTVFRNLKNVALEDEIYYGGETFVVAKVVTVSSEKVNVENLSKESDEKTLVLMSNVDEGKTLIVTAVLK